MNELRKKVRRAWQDARDEEESARQQAVESARQQARRLGVDPSNFGELERPEALEPGHPDLRRLEKAVRRSRALRILQILDRTLPGFTDRP